MPNNPIATITFDSALFSGNFALYDDLHGSGTQITGFFKKGLGKHRWLPPNYSYKFVAYMKSTCENLTDNVYFQTDVTFNFLPRKKGFINEQGGMERVIKTTMFSWYWGPSVNVAIVAFENKASNVKRREDWEEISNFKHEVVDALEEPEESLEISSQYNIMQRLPSNCLEEIFESMDNDRNSLFSCALVNRRWCRASMPILWRRPFEHGYPKKFGRKLIKIYVEFLTREEKELLKTQEIRISSNVVVNGELLFEYPKYIQYFDMKNFIYAIKLCIPSKNKFEQNVHLVARMLGNLFCRHSNGFRSINYQSNNDIKFTDVTSYDGIQSLLYKLKEFNYKGFNVADNYYSSNWINLFNKLAEYAHNIQHLSIHIYKNNKQEYSGVDDAIIELIRSQRGLKSLSLTNFWSNSSILYSIIRLHANTLTCLKLEGLSDISLLIQLLISCHNLDSLELTQTMRGEYHEHEIVHSNLPNFLDLKIKKFIFNFNLNENLLIYFLKSMNRNLKTFSSTLFLTNSSIIMTLKNYNINITRLSLRISESLSDYYENLLKKLPLTYLFLDMPKYQKLSFIHIRQLARSFPHSLLELDLNFDITSKEFELLLDKSNANLVSITLRNSFENRKEYLEIMVNYAIKEIGSLREIRFLKDRNRVNFESFLADELRDVVENYCQVDTKNVLKDLRIGEIRPYIHNFNSFNLT
ncbi:19648_t:CDS:2 [Funneliformis geosporum]|uniref:19648_t:CDS:1 n=1 Tax=Funneliformis geosporum TaxID=1117311 RepID=A0A9W4WLC4_9GLOM|nr:19648_t:CDS:2 [Funneliformis geosporum]